MGHDRAAAALVYFSVESARAQYDAKSAEPYILDAIEGAAQLRLPPELLRDDRVAADSDTDRLGSSSPFNIKLESLRLCDFDRSNADALLDQHAVDTGQPFADGAREAIWEAARGQPWLTNALARRIVERLVPDGESPIDAAHVDVARETLILERQTHLDSLVARLNEPRVRRIVEPLVAGRVHADPTFDDEVRYARDLGLVVTTNPVEIANPIYREIVVRVLSNAAEAAIELPARAYVGDDGRLQMDALLRGFAAFWIEHGDVLTGAMPYHEVAPQLVLMAWQQRVVNGGGHVDREYGVGRGRIDILVRWPHGGGQREAIELEVWAPGRPDPLEAGLAQLDGYLKRLRLDVGTLVIFDRRHADPRAIEIEFADTPSRRRVRVMRT